MWQRVCVDNEIGDEGVRPVAESLKVNHTVTQIVLSGECVCERDCSQQYVRELERQGMLETN